MSRRLSVQLLDAKSAADATGIGVVTQADIANVSEFGFYIEFSAGAAAGTVLIETASMDNYTGTWAVLDTIAWAAASKSHYTAIKGVLRALRVRISGAVTGGTVNVFLVANVV